jgi:vitamin B12 transporter
LLIVLFMKSRINGAQFAALPLALAAAFSALSTSAYSQTQAISQLKETVISASRTPTRADELVSDVTVINRAEIEKSPGRTLPELLSRVPGVQFSSNGGLGKNSSINIRGSEARHTILLIDGVRYGSATTGTPVWDNIPVDMIERIEILKGPASALYGSEAVGGVVQIFMRKGTAGFKPYAAMTLGSESHAQFSAGVTGGTGDVTYALSAQKTREAGFSATNSKVGVATFNPDRDGFEQNSLSGSVAYQVNSSWKLDAGLVYADNINRSDDGLNLDTRYSTLTNVARIGVEGFVLPGWKTQLRYSLSSDANRAIVAAPALLPSLFKTTQNQVSWQNDIDTPIGVALVGVENLTQSIESTTRYAISRRDVMSFFGGLNGDSGRHAWQANLRRDNNTQFGSSTTGLVGYGFSLTPQWRVNASYGTSFVAPSFNQLYFPGFGNTSLQPEKGRNSDFGVTWSDARHSVKFVKYDNRIRGFITSATLPVNIPQARIDGITLAYGGTFGGLTLSASADALNPRNELTGARLPRRSNRQMRGAADYTVGAWTFGGTVLRVGESFNDANSTQKLEGYTVGDVYANYRFSKDWNVQAKINNVTAKVYETILGYNQPGRGIFVTLRWQPN